MSLTLQDQIRTAFRFHLMLRPLRVALYLVVPFLIGKFLVPEEYGVFTATFAVVTLVEGLCLPGVGPLLIRSASLEAASSLFWLALIVRMFICLGFYGMAPHLSALLGLKDGAIYFQVLSVWFVLEGLRVIPDAILVRKLAYRTRFQIYALADLVGIAALAILLYGGFGAWALVGRLLFVSTTILLLSATAGNWRPRFEVRSEVMREFFSLNRDLTIVRLTNQYLSSIDSLLIVSLCGGAEAGLFGMAVKFVFLPLHHMLWPAGELLLPIGKATAKGDVAALYFRYTQVSVFVCLPLLISLTFLADHLGALLGSSWAALPPLIAPMSAVAVAFCFAPPASLYVLTHSSDLDSRLSIFEVFLVSAGIILGAHWGVWGAVSGMAASVACALAVRLPLTLKRIGIPFGRFYKELKWVGAANILLALALFGLRASAGGVSSTWVLDLGCLGLCLSFYMLYFHKSEPFCILKDVLAIRLARHQKVPQ
ncbi:MAG: oligosaccharide flippase family protein [Bdellovibrionaceae bacterium]|nr:oligosaccharide flippase family protein [Bdellovibrionales bacterium]MCB9253856.1 oligosaccharide flippase family protein [Pseudobdellovibrionaceae bacterium]